jgi:twitching motility protein PilT
MQLMGRGDVTVRSVIDRKLLRVHGYRERGGLALALRFLEPTVRDFETLGLPASIERFASVPSGLVIFTGPVGSGKSTTLHSLVKRMDQIELDRHVRIIETPREYEHHPEHIIVSNVTVGNRKDAADVSTALSSALRSDAQCIAFGEVLDAKTAQAAVEAAYGAGALILLTMHGPSVGSAIARLIDMFGGAGNDQEQRLRNQLADAFVGGASLRLVPRSDTVGRIAAAEVVFKNEAIRDMIRRADFTNMRAVIEGAHGEMQTLESHLNELFSSGKISIADARQAAVRPEFIG